MVRAAPSAVGRVPALVAALAAVLACAAPGCAGAGTRPDVVVVMIDTLRPDHLGFHGHHRATPFLAELAAGSTVFPRAYSTSSWTAPATASLFTSLHPPEHGVVEGFMAHRYRDSLDPKTIRLNRLPPGIETLPELLRREGSRTFGLATNINIGPEMAFDRGFDRCYLDHVLRQIFERFGWHRDALVVVVSDHGEEFLEHGDWGHNFSLYGELLRVLAMWSASPGPGPRGGVVGVNGGLIDVLPTLADLLEIRAPESWRGRSLAPLLLGDVPELERELEARPLFAHRARLVPEPRELWAITIGPRKLQLDRFVVALPEPPGTALDVELDEERLRALRSLGYVD